MPQLYHREELVQENKESVQSKPRNQHCKEHVLLKCDRGLLPCLPTCEIATLQNSCGAAMEQYTSAATAEGEAI